MTAIKYECPCYFCYVFPASACRDPSHKRVRTLAEYVAAFLKMRGADKPPPWKGGPAIPPDYLDDVTTANGGRWK